MRIIAAAVLAIVSLGVVHSGLADEPPGQFQQLSEAGRRAISPEIAIGPDGSINVIWLDKGATADRPPPKPRKPGEHSHLSNTDLYFSRSVDAGRSWSAPVRVNGEPGSVWGFAVSKPRIAVGSSGTVHVFFPANGVSPVTKLPVVTARYSRSTDHGRTFSAARTINRPPDFDRTEVLGEGLSATFSFGTMGLAPDGSVVALWQDIGAMQSSADAADIHLAISRDDGASWSDEIPAIRSHAVCPCCQLTLSFNDEDLLLGYRKVYANGRDSTVARSNNSGESFQAETRLPFAAWDIDGCPLKPTELATDGDWVYAASYTGGEDPPGLYFSRSDDGGQTFKDRRQIHPEVAYADAPELTVGPEGRLRLVWQAKIDGARRLFTAESTDHGATFSAAEEIATPPGSSLTPATAVSPQGTVYVVWQQTNEEVYVTALPAAARLASSSQ